MARTPTERVTVRLSKHHLNTIDALIDVGEYRNRTQIIAEAVRDWVNSHANVSQKVQDSQKHQMEIQKLAAQVAAMLAQQQNTK